MCIHTDKALEVIDSLTTSLGEKLRAFSTETCPAFETRELRREFNARIRREMQGTVPNHCGTARSHAQDTNTFYLSSLAPSAIQKHHTAERRQSANEANAQTTDQTSSNPTSHLISEERQSVHEPGHASAARRVAGRRRRTFNLNTYKHHSFGDYVRTIRQYGTVDSFSTEAVPDIVDACFQTTDRLHLGRVGTSVTQSEV
jgi:hypothetical protein